MQYSIAGIMDFNMFGIPLVGADVCGFYENFDQEMCARWMQLSAFYPFARNNYNLTDKGGDLLKPQELYNLVDPYKSAAKNAINQRYSYLRYYYTLLYEISWGRRASMVRPLFFEFPDDSNTYKGYEHSFMIGNALKVTPVITEEDSKNQKVSSYFPKGSRFISLNDFKTIVKGGDSGANVTIGASWSSTIVHMKDGTIIPYQDTLEKKFAVTDNLISKDGLDLLVFPDINGYAEGSVYIDNDGTSQKDLDNGQFEYYKIRFTQNTLTIDLIDGKGSSGDRTLGNHVIQNVYILGQFDESLENRTQVCAFSSSMVPKDIQMSYDKTRGIIRLNVTNGTPLYFHDTHAIQYATSDEDVSFCAPKYKVDKVTTVLTADGKQKRVLNVVNATDSGLPNFIATFTMVQNRILRIEIIDEYQTEYRVTDQVFNPKLLPLDGHGVTTDISSVLTTPAEGEDFYFEVHALNNPKVVLYSTKGQEFIHTQYYKKTTSIINNDGHIFGLGERVGDFFLKDGIYTLWARDEPSPTETAKRPGNNVYGTHPVYFSKMKTNNDFFAVFDNNAGAQDFIIESDKNGKKITHIQTSGMTDMFIILNSNLQNVTAEFINLIGKPTMVPEWALGWHQCRYGYNDSRLVSDVVTKFIEYQLPLDAMWTDIEYMDMYKDFSVSQKNFPDLNTLIAGWKKQNIRYVPILDAAIAYEKVAKNTAFQRGTAADVFILDPVEQFKPFVGKVWPGPAVYIDWLTDNAKLFWVKELGALQGLIDFDGMWIDMNEASNFCNGFCSKKVKLDLPIQDHLFYTPGARDLNTKSISIDALHHNHVTEFEVHSLYGFYMSIATSSYFTETLGKRAFVITRSSYTGVGKFASHWLGDNFSTFEMLKYSIGGIYLFSFYGVPVTGADICGFIFNTYPELCARWYAVGAFYPFSRNHNDKAAIPQEPYVDMFSKAIISAKTNATYTDFFREASLKRYSLHIYQYSYIHKASTDGTLYFKPQFYNYPDETKAYLNVESDILLGDSVKLAAMVNPGTIGTFYFPGKNTQWCPIWPKYKYECLSGETTQIFKEVLYDEILAYIKSGSIIPLQNAIDGGFKEENEDFSFDYSSYQNKLPQDGEHYTLEFAKTKPVDIAVLMDKGNSASGWLRYDDGMTQDLNKYTEVKISATGYTSLIFTNYIDLTFSVFKDDSTVKDTMNQKLGSVVVYSAKSYSLGANSACQITTMTGSFIDCTPVYYKTSNIVKYMVKDGLEPDLRNVKSIHISSK